jgi:hypothetical protein
MSTVTVTTAATLLIQANAQRLSLMIANNDTANSVFIGQDATVTSSNGVPLTAQGTLSEDSGGTKMYCGPIYAICAAGTVNVRYWERTR